MTEYTLHRGQFLDWEPSAIEGLSDFGANKSLAVSRSNGNVEIWRTKPALQMSQVIYGSPKQPIRTMASVVKGYSIRLFGASLSGVLVEWDLQRLVVKSSVPSSGSGIWSIAVSPNGKHLAAAHSDGNLRIYDISTDRFELKDVISVSKDKLLSVCWHPKGNLIAVGTSSGQVAVVDSLINSISITFTTGVASESSKNVWAVLFLSTDVIVTGSSGGLTEFWDSNFGTSLHSYREHKADVLSLCVSAKEDIIFSTGVDTQLIMYQSSVGKNGLEWNVNSIRKPHSHDIRVVKIVNTDVYTGGIDTVIQGIPISNFQMHKLYPAYPFPRDSIATLARKPRLLLVRHDQHLDIWGLVFGESANGQANQGSSEPRLIAKVTPKILSNIRDSAISSSGKYVALTTNEGVRLYQLTYANKVISAIAPVFLSAEITSSRKLFFSADEEFLALIGTGPNFDEVKIIRISDASIVSSINHTSSFMSKQTDPNQGQILHIASGTVSSNFRHIAVSDQKNNIGIYEVESGIIGNTRFVSCGHPVSSLVFDTQGLGLHYISNMNHIKSIGVKPGHIHPSGSTIEPVINPKFKFVYNASNLIASPDQSDPSFLFAHHTWFIMRYHLPPPTTQPEDGAQSLSSAFNESLSAVDANLVLRDNPALFFDFLDNKTVFILEQPWDRVISKLPNPIATHAWKHKRSTPQSINPMDS